MMALLFLAMLVVNPSVLGASRLVRNQTILRDQNWRVRMTDSPPESSPIVSNDWCVGRRIVVWAHHKTGTVMGRYASRLLNEGYSQRCVNSGHSMVSFECEVHSKTKLKRIVLNGREKVCVLHLTRDPFEVIVSGMLYHRRGAERWAMKPMDALGPKEIRSAPQWTRMYLSGVAAVHAAATGGASPSQPAAELPMKDAARAAGLAFFSVEPMQELAQELAAPLSEESYSAYLQRVTPRQALLAEFIAAQHQRLPFQANLHTILRSEASDNDTSYSGRRSPSSTIYIPSTQSCHAQACLPAFTEGSLSDCENTWQHLLAAVGTPDDWSSAIAKLVADGSCPQSPKVAALSSKHKAELNVSSLAIPGSPSRAIKKKRPKKTRSEAASSLDEPLQYFLRRQLEEPLSLPPDIIEPWSPAALMAMLQELDRKLLRSSLGNLAELVNCPQTPLYRASSLLNG